MLHHQMKVKRIISSRDLSIRMTMCFFFIIVNTYNSQDKGFDFLEAVDLILIHKCSLRYSSKFQPLHGLFILNIPV